MENGGHITIRVPGVKERGHISIGMKRATMVTGKAGHRTDSLMMTLRDGTIVMILT